MPPLHPLRPGQGGLSARPRPDGAGRAAGPRRSRAGVREGGEFFPPQGRGRPAGCTWIVIVVFLNFIFNPYPRAWVVSVFLAFGWVFCGFFFPRNPLGTEDSAFPCVWLPLGRAPQTSRRNDGAFFPGPTLERFAASSSFPLRNVLRLFHPTCVSLIYFPVPGRFAAAAC